MNTRRGFLAALISAAVLDPERLLWVPGKKLISIPKTVATPTVTWTEISSTPLIFTFEWSSEHAIEFAENTVKVFGNWIHKDEAGNVDAIFRAAALEKRSVHKWT